MAVDLTTPVTFAGVLAKLPRRLRHHAADRTDYAVWACYELEHAARYGDVPFRAGYIAQGIAWTIETGRLPTAAHMAVARMDRRQLARLVVDTAEACAVPGDVPYYLIRRLQDVRDELRCKLL